MRPSAASGCPSAKVIRPSASRRRSRIGAFRRTRARRSSAAFRLEMSCAMVEAPADPPVRSRTGEIQERDPDLAPVRPHPPHLHRARASRHSAIRARNPFHSRLAVREEVLDAAVRPRRRPRDAEEPLGGCIEAGDDSVGRRSEDRVVRRLHDGREVLDHHVAALPPGDGGGEHPEDRDRAQAVDEDEARDGSTSRAKTARSRRMKIVAAEAVRAAVAGSRHPEAEENRNHVEDPAQVAEGA